MLGMLRFVLVMMVKSKFHALEEALVLFAVVLGHLSASACSVFVKDAKLGVLELALIADGQVENPLLQGSRLLAP